MEQQSDKLRGIGLAVAGGVVCCLSAVTCVQGEIGLNKNPTPNPTIIRQADTPLLFLFVVLLFLIVGLALVYLGWKTWRQEPLFGGD